MTKKMYKKPKTEPVTFEPEQAVLRVDSGNLPPDPGAAPAHMGRQV